MDGLNRKGQRMPKLDLTDEELAEWRAFRGLTQASPEKVTAGLIAQIRNQLEVTGIDILELSKRVQMQPAHIRTILSLEKPSNPTVASVAKICNGLNMQLSLENRNA